jgi:hypothetical protein
MQRVESCHKLLRGILRLKAQLIQQRRMVPHERKRNRAEETLGRPQREHISRVSLKHLKLSFHCPPRCKAKRL